MSATIFYRPVPKKKYTIGTYAPSSFWESLESAFNRFGSEKWTFDSSHLSVLRGMSAMVPKSDHPNPYAELIAAIEKYEEIEVWREY